MNKHVVCMLELCYTYLGGVHLDAERACDPWFHHCMHEWPVPTDNTYSYCICNVGVCCMHGSNISYRADLPIPAPMSTNVLRWSMPADRVRHSITFTIPDCEIVPYTPSNPSPPPRRRCIRHRVQCRSMREFSGGVCTFK
jgi:hypothetical protein